MDRRLSPWLVCLPIMLGYGLWLYWSERHFRQSIRLVEAFEVPHQRADSRLPAADPGAVLAVLGLSPQGAPVRSAEAVSVRAVFASRLHESRALLAVAGAQKVYRVGERLPGGSVLRRVEVDRVILWRNGREELLPLSVSKRLLRPAHAEHAPASSLYLRPTAVPSQVSK